MSLKLDNDFFRTAERGEALVATVANMRKCEHVHGVVMLDCNGGEWSATPGDYFMHGEDDIMTTDDTPNILVAKRSYLINPLTHELL